MTTKEHGILFRDEMVRAILGRHICGAKPRNAPPDNPPCRRHPGHRGEHNAYPWPWNHEAARPKRVTRRKSPTWARLRVGDHLWVREVWAYGATDEGGIYYRSDDGADDWSASDKLFYLQDGRWRSSMVMPRRASRIVVPVVSVSFGIPVNTDEEAQLEGFADVPSFFALWHELNGGLDPGDPSVFRIEFGDPIGEVVP